MASGQGSSVLYPVMVEQKRGSWTNPVLLAGMSLAAIAVAQIGWLWWRAPAPDNSIATVKTIVTTAPPAAIKTSPVIAPAQKPEITEPVAPQTAAPPKPVHRLVVKKSAIQSEATPQPVQPSTPVTAVEKTESSAGLQPKDLPALTISGYIRDEQGASLAMINDKLVREGEEVAPGLRLEKITGDSSIFSYKGYRFRR